MADTILLLIFIAGFLSLLLYFLIKRTKLSRTKLFLSFAVGAIIVLLGLYTGIGKVKSDLSRLIHQSSPKKAKEVYGLLFKKPADSCLEFIHFKDQVIPVIDCCIWMEINLCPAELKRIISLKKYNETRFNKSDSNSFLLPFAARPVWWNPQNIGDRLTKLHIKFDKDNEQSIFFGKDSTHVFICDQAL
jgi:hypothetical protein